MDRFKNGIEKALAGDDAFGCVIHNEMLPPQSPQATHCVFVAVKDFSTSAAIFKVYKSAQGGVAEMLGVIQIPQQSDYHEFYNSCSSALFETLSWSSPATINIDCENL